VRVPRRIAPAWRLSTTAGRSTGCELATGRRSGGARSSAAYAGGDGAGGAMTSSVLYELFDHGRLTCAPEYRVRSRHTSDLRH
jgi:hypothetical protein